MLLWKSRLRHHSSSDRMVRASCSITHPFASPFLDRRGCIPCRLQRSDLPQSCQHRQQILVSSNHALILSLVYEYLPKLNFPDFASGGSHLHPDYPYPRRRSLLSPMQGPISLKGSSRISNESTSSPSFFFTIAIGISPAISSGKPTIFLSHQVNQPNKSDSIATRGDVPSTSDNHVLISPHDTPFSILIHDSLITRPNPKAFSISIESIRTPHW